MSTQNQKTLAAYEKAAEEYLKGAKVFGGDEAKWTRSFISDFLSRVPKGSRVLEVGAANGDSAKYIRELGYEVAASDISDAFLSAIKENGLEPIRFNILLDDFPDKYRAIFCWKVFVHFTKNDTLKALKKSYDALEDGGVFAFCFIDKSCKNTDSEWADFPGVFHIGVDRYFQYYSKDEMNAIIKKTKFAITSCRSHTLGNGVTWLTYILEKK